MAIKTRNQIKDKFKTFDRPTQEDFRDWIDSYFHKTEDNVLQGTTPGADNSIVRWNAIGELKGSAVNIDNSGNISTAGNLTLSGLTQDASILSDGINMVFDSQLLPTSPQVGDFVFNNGNIGIDKIPIGTRLNISGGTTLLSQIKFEEGTLKTNPIPGDFEYSGGHWYLTNGARHVISTSAGVKISTITVSDTTTETVVYSHIYSPDELHQDEMIKACINGVISNSSGSDDYIIRVKIGGVTVYTVNRTGGNVTDVGWSIDHCMTIRTDGASGTFVDSVHFSEGNLDTQIAEVPTRDIDTTAALTFDVTWEWLNAKIGNIAACTQGFIAFHH